MKKISNFGVLNILSIFVAIGFFMPSNLSAATTPTLDSATTYGILSSTYTNTIVGTTVNGDIGFTTPPALIPLGVHTNYGSGAPYALAGTNQGTALNALNIQACTFTFPDTAIDLATDVSHGTLGVYTPGVYCTRATRAASIGTAGITLNGAGTYIFRVNGALTSVDNSVVTLGGGASACDVFWTPTSATTLGANTTFVGTIIDDAGITVGAVTSWLGRALSFGGTITTSAGDTLTVPTCTIPAPVTPSAEIGGTYAVPWITPLINVLKVPTPLSLPNGPGAVTYDYTVTNIGAVIMDNVKVIDDKCFPVIYVSGDTNNDSKIARGGVWKYRCTTNLSQTTTNTVTATGKSNFSIAIDTAEATVVVGSSSGGGSSVTPPLIHIVKKPNVFTLPSTGGWVMYSYTVTNPGIAPLSDVNVSDNKCTGLPGRVTGHPGDINKNNLLDSNEVWSFTCLSFLSKTTTNIATAIGYANGLTATDFSSVTVTVPPAYVTKSAYIGFPNTGINPDEENSFLSETTKFLHSIISNLLH